MMQFQDKVQTYIEQHKLFFRTSPLIVGVSGGVDSVALLHILRSLGYECIVAHCNFHLRNEASDNDEAFVRNMANVLQISVHCVDFDTVQYAQQQGISIEMAARTLRYEWFSSLQQKLNAQAVCVAHHADDSIETMLMHLLRGTGLRGLTGIPVRNKNVVRPLLGFTRAEIEQYIADNNIQHITDSSNAENTYQRNKFRNMVLPLLESIHPNVRNTLYESIARFTGTLAIYEQAIEKISANIVRREENKIILDIEALRQQAHVPTVLFEILRPYHFQYSVVQNIIAQLDAQSGKQFYSDTHRLLKDRKHLIVTTIEQSNDQVYSISEKDIEITEPFLMGINKFNISNNFVVAKQYDCVHFDADLLQYPLTLRRWKEGDSFVPFGMINKKKISDFLTDTKCTLLEKENVWVLLSGEDIVWVVGKRISNKFRITDKTLAVLECKLGIIKI